MPETKDGGWILDDSALTELKNSPSEKSLEMLRDISELYENNPELTLQDKE